MIKVLDRFVADKIAAGEVIERPLSIVKELTENSIDAGATTIICEIRNGGKSYIRITDNGSGIPSNEVALAFERHATGKIQNLEDLERIHTLGFRGEALASICAISRLTIVTRTSEESVGTRLEIAGGRIVAEEQCGSNVGTTLIIEDVFYNTPARRKFMRSDGSEASAIIDLIQKLAICYSGIAFRMINNGKTVLTTTGDGNPLHAIQAIYPSPEFRHLIEIQGEGVHGYISDPGTTRKGRSGQIFFVNGRYVQSDIIEKGIQDGYGDRVFSGYPIAILFIETEPDRLDVNIHPNKKEIKFLDASEIRERIASAIYAVLHTEESIPTAISAAKSHTLEAQAAAIPKREPIKDSFDSAPVADKLSPNEEPISIRDFLREKVRETATETTESIHKSDTEMVYDEAIEISNNSASILAESDAKFGADRISIAPPKTRLFDFDDIVVHGYVFDAYIITESDDHLYVLDQHAAHERIMYERIVADYNGSQHPTQPLLVPMILETSSDIYNGERIWMDLLSRTGYDIEDFGSNSFILRGIPTYMSVGEAETFARNLMESPDSSNNSTIPVIDKLIMRSCKSAVKANNHLTDREIKDLLEQLSACVNPFSCPHGRPTFVRISRYEIERAFKRK